MLLLASLTACSYTSIYVPPADGRARLVWRDDKATALLPVSPGSACATAIQQSRGFPPPDGTDVYFFPRFIILEGPISPHLGTDARSATGVHGGPHRASAIEPSSGGGDGKVWVVLAVIATVTLPIVAVILASSTPEDSSETSQAIAAVSAYNSLARTPESPCSPGRSDYPSSPADAPALLPPGEEPQ